MSSPHVTTLVNPPFDEDAYDPEEGTCRIVEASTSTSNDDPRYRHYRSLAYDPVLDEVYVYDREDERTHEALVACARLLHTLDVPSVAVTIEKADGHTLTHTLRRMKQEVVYAEIMAHND